MVSRALSSLGLARSLRLGQRKLLRQRVDLRREQGQFFGEVSLLHASALSTFGATSIPLMQRAIPTLVLFASNETTAAVYWSPDRS